MNINKFERNQRDSFEIRAHGLGEVQQIRVRHDGSGLGSGWHLHSITLHEQTSGRRATAVLNRWMEESDGSSNQLLSFETPATPTRSSRGHLSRPQHAHIHRRTAATAHNTKACTTVRMHKSTHACARTHACTHESTHARQHTRTHGRTKSARTEQPCTPLHLRKDGTAV